MTGMSLGEFLLVCLLVGLMLTEAVRHMQAGIQRISQAEIFSLSTADKLHWIETWANDGFREASATPAFQSFAEGEYATASASGTGDGTASFVFTAQAGALEGEVVTIRPAFPADSRHAVVWVCGLASAPRGFVVSGENRTTLAPAQLLSTCRTPLT